MKLWVVWFGILCSTLAGAAPSSLQTRLVTRQNPPATQLAGPPKAKQPLKSRCNNECLEKTYVQVGCSHAHDWMCLCVEFDGGQWDIANAVQQCFLDNCLDAEDRMSWRGITNSHCGRDMKSLSKLDVWGILRSKQESEMDE